MAFVTIRKILLFMIFISFGMTVLSSANLECWFDPVAQTPPGIRDVWCNLTDDSGDPILNANISHSNFDTNDWYLDNLMDTKGWFLGYISLPKAYNLTEDLPYIYGTKKIDSVKHVMLRYGPYNYPFKQINQTFNIYVRAGVNASNLKILVCNNSYQETIFGNTPISVSKAEDYNGCILAGEINVTEHNISDSNWTWATVDLTDAYNLITENQTGIMYYSIHISSEGIPDVDPANWVFPDYWMPPLHNETVEAFDLNSSTFVTKNESTLISGCGYLNGINNTGNVLHMRMNELSGTTITDISCMNNNGVTYNSPTLGASGIFNTSIDFTSDKYSRIVVLDSNSLDLTQEGTLITWIYINAKLADGGIIHKGRLSDLSDEAYSFKIDSTGHKIQLILRNSTSSTLDSITNLEFNKWYHIAATWDGTIQKIYIDGKLDNSQISDLIPRITNGSLQIGALWNVSAGGARMNSMDGKLDEVHIYNRTLQENEIKAHYIKTFNLFLPDSRVYNNSWEYNNLLLASNTTTINSNYVYFDSNNDYLTPMNITSRKEIVNSSFIFCYSIKRNNTNTGTYYIERWGEAMKFYIESNEIKFQLSPKSPDSPVIITSILNKLRNTEWHRVCGVRSKSDEKIMIYFDGEMIASAPFNNSYELMDFEEVVIGRDLVSLGADKGFQGLLAHMWIHNDSHNTNDALNILHKDWWELGISETIFDNVYVTSIENSTNEVYTSASRTPISFLKIYNMNNETAYMKYNESEKLYHFDYATSVAQYIVAQKELGVNYTVEFIYNSTLNDTEHYYVLYGGNSTCDIFANWSNGKNGQFQTVRVNMSVNTTIPLNKRIIYLCENGEIFPNCNTYAGDSYVIHHRFKKYGNATVYCEVQNDLMNESYINNYTIEIGCWSAYDTFDGSSQGIELVSDLHVCSGTHQMISLNNADSAVIYNFGYKVIIPDNTTFDGGEVRDGENENWHKFIWAFNVNNCAMVGNNVTFKNGEIGIQYINSVKDCVYANIHFINMSRAFDIQSISNQNFSILNNTFDNCGIGGNSPLYIKSKNITIIGNRFNALALDAIANIRCVLCTNITLEQNYYWDIENLQIYSLGNNRTASTSIGDLTCEIGEFGVQYPYTNCIDIPNNASVWGNVIDYYPCTNLRKTNPPYIEIISPENKIYTTKEVLLNLTYSIDAENIWFGWNGTNYTYTNSTIFEFGEGTNLLEVWVNDSIGNENYTNVTFTVNSRASGSSSKSKTEPKFEFLWDCENGTIEIYSEKYTEIRLMNLINYIIYKGITDSNGYIKFKIESDGKYKTLIPSTSKYYSLEKEISLIFCETEEEGVEEIIEEELVEEEIEEKDEKVEIIKEKLKQIEIALNNGDYEIIKELMKQISILMGDTVSQEPGIEEGDVNGNEEEIINEPEVIIKEVITYKEKPFDFIPIILGASIGIVISIVIFFSLKLFNKN